MGPDELLDYCLAKPGAYLDYPFGESVATARLRTADMAAGRIFAEVFTLRGCACVTFRCEALAGLVWRAAHPGVVVRGYHCPPVQQPYSNTMPLDGSVPDDELIQMADEAYDAVFARLPRYRQRQLQTEHGGLDTVLMVDWP